MSTREGQLLSTLGVVCFLLWAGCGGSEEDDQCADGETRCSGLYEIEHCRDSSWSAPEDCPPLEGGDGFEVTTVCDEGLCRP
jgi:hypothetical protein